MNFVLFFLIVLKKYISFNDVNFLQHQSKIEIDTAIIRYRLQKTKNPSPIFILLKLIAL